MLSNYLEDFFSTFPLHHLQWPKLDNEYTSLFVYENIIACIQPSTLHFSSHQW